MQKVLDEVKQKFTNAGFKISIVPAEHLPGLKGDLENFLEQGMLDRNFYDEVVSRYDLYFDFQLPVDFPTAKSIFITAAPQSMVRVQFERAGKTYPVIIPPTYLHDTDREVWELLSLLLGNYGYKIHQALLPEKPLAVRSGLAKYGRNNIAYIDGWGSFFRLQTFFTDLSGDGDNWQELRMMDRCSHCRACIKNCPAHVITEERFLIRAERCLTFFNEGESEFPAWVDPAWHNCLVGCMKCQEVCPENKNVITWVSDAAQFTEEETSMLIEGVPKEKLPAQVLKKLAAINLLKDYYLLQRNLGALLINESRE
jgi:epoxyqueuosine reductase